MKLWGKEITRDEAIVEISRIQAEIFRIEGSAKYAEYSEVGNDALIYQIEAMYEEMEMLKRAYNIA